MSFRTVTKNSKESDELLTGRFSKQYRALFVRPFTKSFTQNLMTFKIVSTSEIKKPHFIISAAKLFRLPLLLFTVVPIAVLMIHFYFMKVSVDLTSGWFALSSLLFLHGAVFCFNDYFDHVGGSDVMQGPMSDKVIQRGYFSAHQVLVMAISLLVVALGLAIPVFWVAEGDVLAIVAVAALSIVTYSFFGKGLKSYGWGELAVFLCLGPLLVSGFSRVYTGEVSADVLLYGALNGLLAVLFVQHRNFATMLGDNIAGVKTFMSRLGFDKAKAFLIFSFVLNITLVWSFNFYLLPSFPYVKVAGSVLFFIIYGLLIYWYVQKIRSIKSPVSSQLAKMNLSVLGLSVLLHLSYILISFVQFGFFRRLSFTTKLEVLSTINKFLSVFGL